MVVALAHTLAEAEPVYIPAEAEPVYTRAVVARAYTWEAASARTLVAEVVAAHTSVAVAGLLPHRAREAREA